MTSVFRVCVTNRPTWVGVGIQVNFNLRIWVPADRVGFGVFKSNPERD